MLLGVDGLADLLQRGLELLHRGVQRLRVGVLPREEGADCVDLVLHLGADVGRDLVAELGERALRLIGGVVGEVADLDELAALPVLLGVGLRLLDEAVDLVLGQAGAGGDRDALLLPRGLVGGLHVEDAVHVEVERDLDLGHAARGGSDAVELEPPDALVLGGVGALALEHVDVDGGLAVGGGGEGLLVGGGDGGVALDEGRHHAAERLDAEREWRDVEQQDVGDLALEDARLDGGADGDDLVGVLAAVGLPAEELLRLLDDGGHARHTADEHDLGDVLRVDAGVLQCLAARADGAVDEVGGELLELGAGERNVEVLGAGAVGGDERQVDVRLLEGGELDLGALGGLLEALDGHAVAAEVDALVAPELVGEPLDDALVEVVAAEVSVAVGRLHLEHAVADVQHGDVERTPAQVEDDDELVLPLVEAVGERGRRGLVDDAEDLEPGDGARVLRGLALAVVEVGGHGDDGLRDGLAELRLRVRLQLLEHHRRDLRRGVVPVTHHDGDVAGAARLRRVAERRALALDLCELPPDEPLDGVDRVLRVRNGLPLGDRADVALAALRVQRDDGGGGAASLRVLEHQGLAGLHHGHSRVGGAQVDADYLSHCSVSSFSSG